jgi:excisionase family DNA binding protein
MAQRPQQRAYAMITEPRIELLSVKDTIVCYRIGRTRLYELMKAGEIRAIKIGRSVRIRRTELEAWIARQPAFGECR